MKLFFAVPGEAIRPLMQQAWKGSLSFHQQGLLMLPNRNDRGDSGRQGRRRAHCSLGSGYVATLAREQ